MVQSIKNLIAALLIAISGYLAFTEILPAYTVTTFLKDSVAEKEELLASRTEILQRIENLRKESNSKFSELQRLALVVPEKKDLPEIITAVENIYSRSGLVLTDINMGSIGKDQVSKISLENSAEGTYSQFLNLLDYLEKNIRIFDVSFISVGLPGTEAVTGDKDPSLGFMLKGQFYWLNQQAVQTPQPEAPANTQKETN